MEGSFQLLKIANSTIVKMDNDILILCGNTSNEVNVKKGHMHALTFRESILLKLSVSDDQIVL